ncbi:MAG TPA: ABC transporter permease [Dehalococcoidales bacterium]|nr:ABC transporter permease [Dehalococcoidales bacterium]
MNKTGLIFKNELLTTLRRKGFIITTLALPVLGALALLVFQIVSTIIQPDRTEEITRVGYVDQVGIFQGFTQQDRVHLIAYDTPLAANQALVAGEIKEYLVIPPDYLVTGLIGRFTMRTEIEAPAGTVSAIETFLVGNLLRDAVSPEVAARVFNPLFLSNVILDESGQPSTGRGGLEGYLIAYVFAFLLLMSIFTASGYLLQGLSEEKENRVMEILLSSVSTRQLITGKVLALGAVGLIQIVLWLVSGFILVRIASDTIGGLFATLTFPPEVIILCLVYFVLGYFVYAVLMAGIGAVAPTQRDGGQMSLILTLSGSVPFMLMPFIIENSTHVVTRILTLFPLTAPLTVMIRINSGVPLWEILLSLLLLALSIWGGLLLASKVFRIYLLMYGKTPGLKEIIRSLRQAG